MPNVCLLRGTVSLQQRIETDIATKLQRTIGVRAERGGHRILSEIAKLPSVEAPLREFYDRGRLGQIVPYFRKPPVQEDIPVLDPETVAHTFLVCEAAQHFIRGNVNWFFDRSSQITAPDDFRRSFTTIRSHILDCFSCLKHPHSRGRAKSYILSCLDCRSHILDCFSCLKH